MEPDSPITIGPDTHRFLVDLMLGTLVPYLRICGYDTVFVGDRAIDTDTEIEHTARLEHRFLITRDTALATQTTHSLLITSQAIEGQLRELHNHGVQLEPTTTPERCGNCNTQLNPVPNTTKIPEYVPADKLDGLWQCPACEQYFWQGSHWDNMQQHIDTVTAEEEHT